MNCICRFEFGHNYEAIGNKNSKNVLVFKKSIDFLVKYILLVPL